MKTYDETIQSIFSKGDAIIEKKRTQIRKIEKTSAAVSGLCAAAIVSVSFWRITNSHKLTPNDFPDDNFIDKIDTITSSTTESVDKVTTNTVTSVASTTSNPKTTSKDTTITSMNTSISTNITSFSEINTTQRIYSTTQNTTISYILEPVTTSLNVEPTTTTLNNDPVTTSHINTTSTSLSVNPVTTSITTSSITTTTFNIQDSFRAYTCVFRFNDGRYEKEGSSIANNSIGDFIKEVSVNITLSNNWVIIENMEVYEIQNISIEEAVAVKLKGTEEYYLFKNVYYKKEELIQ